MGATAPIRISVRLFLVNVVGIVLLNAGLAGLLGIDLNLPFLANRYIDIVLLLLGVGLMGWFLLDLMKRGRVNQSYRVQQDNH